MAMPVKCKGILKIIFGIYTHCLQIDFLKKVKFECQKDVHFKTHVIFFSYAWFVWLLDVSTVFEISVVLSAVQIWQNGGECISNRKI